VDSSDNRLVRLIALFKLLKAAILIAVGVGALKLLHRDSASVLEHWVAMLGLDPGSQYVDSTLQRLANLTPNKLKGVGVGSFIYAGLFLTEGIGLWLVRRWAEWLTVVITSSLVPLEIYGIFHRPTVGKVLVLTINVVLVGYLIYRIRNEQSHQR
jgi:uncharacterized membrane protein (DUF2068 family)